MPVGPFPDFSACEAHYADDPDIDDPGGFCKYLEQMAKDEDVIDGTEAMYGGDVQFISLVDNPAVLGSEWMKSKDSRGIKIKVKNAPFLTKSNKEEADRDLANHVKRAPALIPDVTDGNGEIASKDEIYKMALKFMEYRKVDSQHDFEEGKGKIVFNDILRHDEKYLNMDGEERTMPEGTWMVGIQVTDEKEWELIESGERKGVSIAGFWQTAPVRKSRGNPMSRKEDETIGTVAEQRVELENIMMDLLSMFEEENGVRIEGLQVDRGKWGEDESWDHYRARPLKGIRFDAYLKSKASEPINGVNNHISIFNLSNDQEVTEMEDKAIKQLISDTFAEIKANTEAEEVARKEKEEAETLTNTIKALTERLTAIEKGLSAIGKKDDDPPDDDEEDDKDDEEEEEKGEDEEEEDKDEEEEEEKEEEKADEKETTPKSKSKPSKKNAAHEALFGPGPKEVSALTKQIGTYEGHSTLKISDS